MLGNNLHFKNTDQNQMLVLEQTECSKQAVSEEGMFEFPDKI